jgi:RND family efflux transporter MFP subunit
MNHKGKNPRPALAALAALLAAGPVSGGEYPGLSKPLHDIVVSAAVDGRVEKVLVEEGRFVKAGEILVEMRKVMEELEVQRRKLVMDDRSELAAAELKVRTAREDFEAEKALLAATGSVSRSSVAAKELLFRQAGAELEALELAEKREVLEYEMAVEARDSRVIRAPIDGAVADLFVEAGEDCKAREKVVRLVDTRRFYFEVNVEERHAGQLAPGTRVPITLDPAGSGQTTTGEVVLVSPVVDAASGLLRVRLLCDNPDGKVRPGVAGKIKLAEAQP